MEHRILGLTHTCTYLLKTIKVTLHALDREVFPTMNVPRLDDLAEHAFTLLTN